MSDKNYRVMREGRLADITKVEELREGDFIIPDNRETLMPTLIRRVDFGVMTLIQIRRNEDDRTAFFYVEHRNQLCLNRKGYIESRHQAGLDLDFHEEDSEYREIDKVISGYEEQARQGGM